MQTDIFFQNVNNINGKTENITYSFTTVPDLQQIKKISNVHMLSSCCNVITIYVVTMIADEVNCHPKLHRALMHPICFVLSKECAVHIRVEAGPAHGLWKISQQAIKTNGEFLLQKALCIHWKFNVFNVNLTEQLGW